MQGHFAQTRRSSLQQASRVLVLIIVVAVIAGASISCGEQPPDMPNLPTATEGGANLSTGGSTPSTAAPDKVPSPVKKERSTGVAMSTSPPSSQNPSPATSMTTAPDAGLSISCTIDDAQHQVACNARGYAEGSRLYWWTNSMTIDEGEGSTFAFSTAKAHANLRVMLEACQGASCTSVETVVMAADESATPVTARRPAAATSTSEAGGPAPERSAPDAAPTFDQLVVLEEFPGAVQAKLRSVVDQVFASATETAGLAVGVYQSGKLWTYALGDAEASRSMTPNTPMLIRSVSKTFLAAAVLQQVNDGLYGLFDPISSVLADHPGFASLDSSMINGEVTVAELLSMRSGLGDYGEVKDAAYTAVQTGDQWQPLDLIQLVRTPYGPRGSYEYSNTNSTLLGIIVEHYGGMPLNRLLTQRILSPLQITAGLLPQDGVPAGIARPHDDLAQWGGGSGFGDISKSWQPDWFLPTNRTTWIGGGMVTTADNLARWGYELLSEHGAVLNGPSRELLVGSFAGDPVRLAGTVQWYGYHVAKRDLQLDDGTVLTVYGHPGAGGGFTAGLYYAPALDVSVAVLANSHTRVRTHDPGITSFTGVSIDAVLRGVLGTWGTASTV